MQQFWGAKAWQGKWSLNSSWVQGHLSWKYRVSNMIDRIFGIWFDWQFQYWRASFFSIRNCSVPGIGCFEDKLRAVPLRPRPLHVLRVLVVRSDVFVLQGLRDVMERLFTSKLRSKDLSGTLHHPCYPILNAADAECQLIDGSLDWSFRVYTISDRLEKVSIVISFTQCSSLRLKFMR